MAKEMMIVFVYDTQCCTEEEDDPADAVLYFHPGWVSDTQRHALAGQVVGTAHCVKSLFSQPVAITLQSGKFIIREYGRYILAIGSDRNIPDWVLKNRANLLTSMIKVYHGDLNTVAAMFPGENNTRFSDKLYQMFETYLPVLQYGCHIFQRVPMLTLPKSATSIYLEAMDILNHCRKSKGILGGVILYNNKIIATTLPPSLTSYLTVVDPYRIKSPAESVQAEVPLPLGVQLLYVYVDKKTHEQMVKQNRAMWEFTQSGEEIIARFKKNQELEREKLREFPQTGMKRDKSLLFTAVPEEDHNLISPPVGNNQLAEESRRLPAMPDVVPFTNKPRPRPTKLSLSFKNQKSLDEEIKEKDEKVFTGQTSVCSTPMVEYKRLHGNVLSICQQNPESTSQIEEKLEPDVLKNIENGAKVTFIQKEIRDNKVLLDINCIGEHFINKPDPIRKTASISEIHETFKRISSRASARFKLRKSNTERDETPSPERKPEIHNMTINDPSFPVFRSDGVEISESLFNQYLKQRYTQLKEQDLSKEDNMFTFNRKLYEQEKFEGFDLDMTKSPQRTPKKVSKDSSRTVLDQSKRKSLSLPLKSLSESTDSGSESEVSGFKKKLSGVQLTPLMEKLSHLAFSDKSSGYSSRVMTPLELREFSTPCVEKHVAFGDRSKAQREESDSEDEDTFQWFGRHSERTALFVSGLQNMAMMLLLDHQQLDPQTIHAMWELSLNALGPIEQKCMDLPPTTEGSEYSYLTLDPDWGTVSKGGPWASLDIATMGLIHSEFCDDTDLTEFMLRSEESVVLGLACGGAHVYYGERQAGLSHDALHAAGTRARRRLARDHAVLTL